MRQLLGLGPAGGNRLCIAYARSYVASVMALAHKRLTEVKYVFDMRGFGTDERLEGGLWPREGSMYRVARYFAELLRMRPGPRLLVVNRGEHACIRERVAAVGVEDDAVGIVLRSFASAALYQGLSELLALAALPQTSELCRAAAHKHFSPQGGVRRYSLVYAQLEGGAA